jgi:hypothetical protein
MNDRQIPDKGQENTGEVIGQPVADRFQTALIAAGLVIYIAASAWGMTRAGFRPCSAGECIISPHYAPSGMTDSMILSKRTGEVIKN